MKKLLCIAVLALGLVACGGDPTPIAAPQVITQAVPQGVAPAAPVVVVQQPAQQNHDGLFTGMLLGHMMAGGFGGGSSAAPVHNTTVVNKTVINRPAAPSRSYSAPSRSYSAPSRSFSRGRR